MPSLFVLPKQVPLSSAAGLLAGAKLLFSATGSSTPQNTYTDILLTTPSANPVIADANGVFAPVYLDPSLPNYRVILKTSADVVLYTVDDVPSNQNTSQQFRLKAAAPDLLFEETDASAGNKKWRWHVNAEVLTLDIGNDAESIWTTVLSLTRGGLLQLGTSLSGPQPLISGASGTFTGTLTGMTATVTGTVNYYRVGSLVVLLLGNGIIGTSNTTAMTLTGLPAILWPNNVHSGACYVFDNSADLKAAMATVLASTVTFKPLVGTSYSATGFTNSGTKGLAGGWTMIYPIDSAPF